MPRDSIVVTYYPIERHCGNGFERQVGHRSNRDWRLDRRMWIVVLQLEVLKTERVYVLYLWIDCHFWQRFWIAFQLQFGLIDVVRVKVQIAERVDEVSWG